MKLVIAELTVELTVVEMAVSELGMGVEWRGQLATGEIEGVVGPLLGQSGP